MKNLIGINKESQELEEIQDPIDIISKKIEKNKEILYHERFKLEVIRNLFKAQSHEFLDECALY